MLYKNIFTIMKRILISISIIVAGLFCIADFSTALMDWQFYKAESMSDKCSGNYIFDDKLYEEVKGEERYKKDKVLSNGFLSQIESLKIPTKYSRIAIIGENIFYIDNNNIKHTIYQIREYRQIYFKIALKGDEGRGFDWETKRTRSNSSSSADIHDRGTIIYIEEKNNGK